MPQTEALRTTRKRARSSNAEAADLPAGKKARLDATPTTTADVPKSSTTVSTGRPGRGASKSNATGTTPNRRSVYDLPVSDDEVQSEDSPTKKVRRSSATRTSRNVYDVPESDDELSTPIVEKHQSARPSEGQQSANGSTSKRRGRSGKTNKDETSELPLDELASSIPNGSAPKRKGRSSIASKDGPSEAAQDDLASATANGTKTATNSSAPKRRGRTSKATEHKTREPANDAVPLAKPGKRPTIWELRRAATRGIRPHEALAGKAAAVPNQTEPQSPAPDSTPGGHTRHADRDIGGDTPKLKGILTPSRKDGTPRTRKSVAFNSGGDQEREVYFEDLPSKPTGKKALKSPKELPKTVAAPFVEGEAVVDADGDTQMQEDEEEVDEEVCSICKKPDSAPPNEIIFCDGCDMAVHQKCYNVPTIPEGDWLCRSCSQDDALVSQAGGPEDTSVSLAKRAEKIPDIPDFEQHLRAMQRVLIDRCTGRRSIPLRGQDEAYEKAFQLVEQTVLAGEGNSMLVIGARGSGKTTLVETIVSEMSTSHKDEFHVVRLNGFIHTDDKIALKEIWRQLGKEMDVEDDLINRTNNYADTLASLLAVLSHPSEIADTQQGVTSKSVIFIIDEFDLFATHARQTLLYNLFDIAQARKAPIAVLGLTTRIDVVESLEKRVKSRFSHRYVYLSLAKSLPAFWDICRHGLTVGEDDAEEAGFDTSQPGLSMFLAWWNKNIEALHKDAAFQGHLEHHFHATKSVPGFLTTCVLPLASLTPTSPSLQPHFTPSSSSSSPTAAVLDPPDSKLHLLPSLSDLDLSLLIAAARLDIVAHTDTVNFAMAYDEYAALVGRHRVQSASSGLLALGAGPGARVWGRGVAAAAWERLARLGLLVPATAGAGGRGLGAGGGGGAGLVEGRMWKVDVALEEIPACVRLNQVLGRWCREI